MILTGKEILEQCKNGTINIEPFNKSSINPNSYDIHLGSSIFKYSTDTLDIEANNNYESINLDKNGFILEKDTFYFAYSEEIVGSDTYVPILHNKSGIARMGLFTHITSDLLSLNSKGKVLIQLYPSVNIKIYPQMEIAQISFWKTKGEI